MASKTLNSIDYLNLLKETAQTISWARSSKEPIDKKQMAELYSIYYNIFAGALRAKCMFEKSMDVDGYPKYLIRVGEEKYYCKDVPLRDILKEDYERITKFPYEDTSESYVRAYMMDAAYKEIQEAEIASGESAIVGKDASADEQARLKKKVLRAEQKKQEALLKEKNRQLLKDARGFDYDPNYDHYYSDVLPDVVKELDSTAEQWTARIVAVVVCAIGFVCALALLGMQIS